jgi:hypothetical protein
MDLNYLYHRQQVSLHLSEHATSSCARSAHRRFAEGYASQIALAKLFHAMPK